MKVYLRADVLAVKLQRYEKVKKSALENLS